MNPEEKSNLQKKANEIRISIIKMINSAKSGHPAGSLGVADIMATLYFKVLKNNPKKPGWKDRDFFVLSNGHVCPALYTTMAKRGFFQEEELMSFRKINSRLQGHPHREGLPGLETSSGPLGCGLSQAAGMALALKLDKKKNKVYCLTSDGEHDEGNIWEGVLFAAKYKLNNLICILDRNFIQIDGSTEEVMPLNDLKAKYAAFGWNIIETDGHDIEKLVEVFLAADYEKEKPTMIIAKTTPGKGVSFMENDYKWHGKAPNDEEAKKALQELEKSIGW